MFRFQFVFEHNVVLKFRNRIVNYGNKTNSTTHEAVFGQPESERTQNPE